LDTERRIKMSVDGSDGGFAREEGGTYTLLVELPEGTYLEIGALGTRTLDAGWYAYTGSALGSGGFSRVERHLELAAGERSTHLRYAPSRGPLLSSVADAHRSIRGGVEADGG
jgi:hypothetical protein